VQESLDKFFADELMGLDNAYSCETCKRKTGAVRHTSLHTLPPVLILQFKRAAYTTTISGSKSSKRGKKGGRVQKKLRYHRVQKKFKHHVSYPEILSTKNYTTSTMEEQGVVGDTLQLFAVVVHIGDDMESGHYVSYVRGEVGGKEVFYFIDDIYVTSCTKHDFLSQEAYILFYEKDFPINGTSLCNMRGELE